MTPQAKPWRQVGILSLAIVLAMAPWFAATVVAIPLSEALNLPDEHRSWLTLAVQLGFVLGSLTSAILLLSDRWSAKRLAAWSALVAALATAALVMVPVTGWQAIGLRLLTGACFACVYPPGMKIAAGWTRQHRGTAIGLLTAAVSVGSAGPHLILATWDASQWRAVLIIAAISATLGSALFAFVVREGPYQSASAPFDPSAIASVLRERGVRLSTGGYLGHMWELYAMWSTIGIFLGDTGSRYGVAPVWGPLLGFAAIAIGGVGCVVAGVQADRIGRARVAMIAMAVSGSCALLIGHVSSISYGLTILVALVWGMTVVADSAQFSALVADAAPAAYVGTALTLQTASGFLLTMLTIHLVPGWAERWGWEFAYLPLALGPALGIVAMSRLRRVTGG
jgi:MFS family permease